MVTVRVEGLEFRYNAHPVFAGVNVAIEKGEVVSIVGCNGAGKSTLLKCMNHILEPVKGRVVIGGEDLDRMHFRERARRLGYLSQKGEQLFPTTVFEVVLTGRYPHSPVRFTRRDEQIVAEVLAMMELGAFADRPFDRLSGGEQQQVLIARALAQGAEVLLFDEPTSSLDLHHQLGIMQLIRHIAHHKHITPIVAIHDLNLAAGFSDTVLVVHDKGIYAAGRPAEVLTVETLREVFGVEAKVYDHGGIPHIVMVGLCQSGEPGTG
jgi:iron complex transport system ATP-binding protein